MNLRTGSPPARTLLMAVVVCQRLIRLLSTLIKYLSTPLGRDTPLGQAVTVNEERHATRSCLDLADAVELPGGELRQSGGDLAFGPPEWSGTQCEEVVHSWLPRGRFRTTGCGSAFRTPEGEVDRRGSVDGPSQGEEHDGTVARSDGRMPSLASAGCIVAIECVATSQLSNLATSDAALISVSSGSAHCGVHIRLLGHYFARAATSNSFTCGRVKLLHPGAVGRVEHQRRICVNGTYVLK